MQVALFKALQSIHIPDEQATEVVDAVEEHLAMKVSDANAALRAELASSTARLETEITGLGLRLETEIGAIRSILESQRWFMSAIIVLLAIIGLAPTFARIFH